MKSLAAIVLIFSATALPNMFGKSIAVQIFPSPDKQFVVVYKQYADSSGSPTLDLTITTSKGSVLTALALNAGSAQSVSITWSPDSKVAVGFIQFARATYIVSAQFVAGAWRRACGPATLETPSPIGLSRVQPEGWNSASELALTTNLTFRDGKMDTLRSVVRFGTKRVEEVEVAPTPNKLLGLWTVNYTP